MSCYALFKGWLLLSQPPGCLRDPTSFLTEPALGGLSRRSGLFPSRRRSLSLAVSLPGLASAVLVVGLGLVGSRPLAHPVPYPRGPFPEAAPKGISGRTSYLRARLAYHHLPPAHPRHLPVPPVRASRRSYPPFTLARGSSPGFGSHPGDSAPSSDSLSLRLRDSGPLTSPPR